MMVTSILNTGRMVIGALATTSTYTVMVSSEWGRYALKMERNGLEAHGTRQMAVRRNMMRNGGE